MRFHKGTYFVYWCDSDGRSYRRDPVYDLEDIWKDVLYNTYRIRASFIISAGEVETDGTWHVIITAMFEEGQPYRVIHSCLDNGDRPGFSVWGFWTCEEA